MHAAVLFHRFGPYHVARLAAAGGRGTVTAIELSTKTGTYAWDAVQTPAGIHRRTVCDNDTTISATEFHHRLTRHLNETRPTVLFVNGWSGRVPATALRWCANAGVPAVLMSESSATDEPRRAWKEVIKRRLVSCFSAALVGGSRHRDYAVSLGLPADRVFLGYDAVDNAHFVTGSDAVRRDPNARQHLGLPDRYFLASNRFIPKKNLAVLLNGYAEYRKAAGPAVWDLVLLGDGPLRGEVEQQIGRSGLAGCVHLPGFKQYHELPAYYGLAEAFVHASTTEQWGLVVNEAMASGLPVVVSDRCGCVPELLAGGLNGFIFPPESPSMLADRLLRIAQADDTQRAAMGTASRERVSKWGPEAFASGFWKAAEAAVATPLPRRRLLDHLLLRLL